MQSPLSLDFSGVNNAERYAVAIDMAAGHIYGDNAAIRAEADLSFLDKISFCFARALCCFDAWLFSSLPNHLRDGLQNNMQRLHISYWLQIRPVLIGTHIDAPACDEIMNDARLLEFMHTHKSGRVGSHLK